MNKLLNRFRSRNRSYRAPMELNGIASFGDGNGNFGGGGGGNGQQQQSNQNGNGQGNNGGNGAGGNNLGPMFGQEDDEGVDQDLQDVLGAFADVDDQGNPVSSNDDTYTPAEMPVIPQERVTAMQNEVGQLINNMRLPDNLIPDNFDPSDRGQLNQLMSTVMQHTLRNSLNVVFKPVQLAMQQQASNFETMLGNRINESRVGQREVSIIEATVPEINDPKLGPMIKNMDSLLKSKNKPAKERATTLRKMLNQMGITAPQNNGNSRRTSNPGGNQSSGMSTGKAALDKFFLDFGGNGGGNNGQR